MITNPTATPAICLFGAADRQYSDDRQCKHQYDQFEIIIP